MTYKVKTEQMTTTEGPRARKKPGRATKSAAELWARRAQVYRLWAIGLNKTEISHQFGISSNAIADDLKAMIMITDLQETKIRIDAGYREIARTAFEKAKTSRDGDSAVAQLLREAREALARLAKLHGYEQDINNFSATQIINAPIGANPYAGIDNREMEREYNRQQIFIRSGNKKARPV